MTPTQATQAAVQPTRRDRETGGTSARPPESAVTRPRAGGRLAGSGDRQAATVFRSGSGRLATSGRPAANRMVWAQASRSAEGVAGPYGGVVAKWTTRGPSAPSTT